MIDTQIDTSIQSEIDTMIESTIDMPSIEGLIDNEIDARSDWSGEIPDNLSDFHDNPFDDPPSTNHELDEIPLDEDACPECNTMLPGSVHVQLKAPTVVKRCGGCGVLIARSLE